MAHRIQGSTYLHLQVYYIVKDMIKGIGGQSGEEVHGQGLGGS